MPKRHILRVAVMIRRLVNKALRAASLNGQTNENLPQRSKWSVCEDRFFDMRCYP